MHPLQVVATVTEDGIEDVRRSNHVLRVLGSASLQDLVARQSVFAQLPHPRLVSS